MSLSKIIIIVVCMAIVITLAMTIGMHPIAIGLIGAGMIAFLVMKFLYEKKLYGEFKENMDNSGNIEILKDIVLEKEIIKKMYI